MKWMAVAGAVLMLAACASRTPAQQSAASRGPALQSAAAKLQVHGRPAPGTAPANTRPVTFHGLTVFVPASWATNAVRCGAPLRDTVIFDDLGGPLCGSVGRPEFSTARFRTWTRGAGYHLANRTTIAISGYHAVVSSGHADGDHLTELDVPDLKVMLLVAGPSPSLGRRIIESAQVTQTDADGCASTLPYLDLTSPPTSGPADVMVAGTPSAVAVCHYLRTYLEQGVRLSAVSAVRLVAALNALPTGLSEVSRSTYLPSLCRGGKLAAHGDASDREDFTIRLSYAGRPTAVVYGRLGLCGAVGFTNGTRTGQRGDAVVNLLNTAFHDGLAWPGGIHPR